MTFFSTLASAFVSKGLNKAAVYKQLSEGLRANNPHLRIVNDGVHVASIHRDPLSALGVVNDGNKASNDKTLNIVSGIKRGGSGDTFQKIFHRVEG
ncbi:MAG: hypothetical protein U0003_05195 [Vampirovibrionales bacterium]